MLKGLKDASPFGRVKLTPKPMYKSFFLHDSGEGGGAVGVDGAVGGTDGAIDGVGVNSVLGAISATSAGVVGAIVAEDVGIGVAGADICENRLGIDDFFLLRLCGCFKEPLLNAFLNKSCTMLSRG